MTNYDLILTVRVECEDYEAALQRVAQATLALSESLHVDSVAGKIEYGMKGEVEHVCSPDECGMEREYDFSKADKALVAKSTPPAILRDIMAFRNALDDHAMVWPRVLYELTDEDLTIIFDFARMQQEGST